MARHITTAAPPSFTYLYSPMVDTVAHRDGPDAPSVRAAVREVDRELERLAGAVQGRARIVVSADHGFVAVPESAKHIVQPGDALLELLAVPPSASRACLSSTSAPATANGSASTFEHATVSGWRC